MALVAEEAISNWCDAETSQCNICSYDSCTGNIPGAECGTNFPDIGSCIDCGAESGIVASFEHSAYRIPND